MVVANRKDNIETRHMIKMLKNSVAVENLML